MRVAAIFGPGAGGSSSFRAVGRLLSERLEGHEVLACPGALGAGLLDRCALCEFEARGGYVENLRAAALRLGAEEPDLLVCVGGDGLASYVADALVGLGLGSIPILGVAGGTANVGPFVSVTAAELGGFRVEELLRLPVGAVEARDARRRIGLGFNDVVAATTFLGTVDGRAASLSAQAMALRGEALEEEPDPRVAGPDFRVEKNGLPVAGGSANPAQIVASPLGEREFYGRAVTGALCESAYSDCKAALVLLDSIIVRPGRPGRGLADFARSEQLLFGPGDRVVLRGLEPRAAAIVDGNPFLLEGGELSLAYLPGVAVAARMRGDAGEGDRVR